MSEDDPLANEYLKQEIVKHLYQKLVCQAINTTELNSRDKKYNPNKEQGNFIEKGYQENCRLLCQKI